jgi:hypothetical protein
MKDKKAIDIYTFIHALFGYVAAKKGLSKTEILILAGLYEIIEPSIINTMKNGANTLDWNHESRQNIIVDIAAALVGAKLAK